MINLYKDIVDIIDCPVVVFDSNKRIKFINNSFKKLVYGSSDSFEDSIIDEFIHQGSLKKFRELMEYAAKNNETDYREIIISCGNEAVTLNVKIKKTDGFFIMCGTPVDFLADRLQKELIILNNESNNLNRELNKKKALLEKKNKELEVLYSRIDAEINKAANIHKRVLPDEIPQTEQVQVAAHYQPATQLGGDSYNVIKIGDKLLFYVADVAGHGLDGAMISVFIKEAIDSFIVLRPKEISPQKILQHLNNQYHREDFPEDQLVCIFLGILDLKTLKLSYCSAGVQILPLVSFGGNEKTTLQAGGLFISSSIPKDINTFEEKHIKLTPGTAVLITTDGLAEQNRGKELFLKNCEKTFFQSASSSAGEIVETINREFYEFNEGSLVGKDDITYLVIKILD